MYVNIQSKALLFVALSFAFCLSCTLAFFNVLTRHGRKMLCSHHIVGL